MSVQDTLNDRGSRYGTLSDNAQLIHSLMRVLKRGKSFHKFTDEHRECVHMIFHKLARMANGDPFYSDNAHDIAGYAVLLEQFLIDYDSEAYTKDARQLEIDFPSSLQMGDD